MQADSSPPSSSAAMPNVPPLTVFRRSIALAVRTRIPTSQSVSRLLSTAAPVLLSSEMPTPTPTNEQFVTMQSLPLTRTATATVPPEDGLTVHPSSVEPFPPSTKPVLQLPPMCSPVSVALAFSEPTETPTSPQTAIRAFFSVSVLLRISIPAVPSRTPMRISAPRRSYSLPLCDRVKASPAPSVTA